MSGKNDAMYGKFEHPIKMIIEAESNAQEKQKGILDFLFNVEKSSHYGETTQKYLTKLALRTGHTFKKMIEAYEQGLQ